MTEKFENQDERFYVSEASGWHQFTSLEKAEAEARKRAWNNAEDYYIFKPIAVARAPEQINNVNIETL